jgi:hypothetical protein
MGKYDDALASYAKQGALLGHSEGESRNMASVYAAMGKADEARRLVGPHMHRWPEVHVALGDKDTAFSLLLKSVDKQQSDEWPLYVMSDPQYERLHGDPRWNELLARMNFVTN